MGKATLVVMAAGIGSRFGGGIKQLEPVGPNGEIIVDYSVYDAIEAGFDKVVFVIRRDIEKDFKEVIGTRIAKMIEVEYAFQEVSDIPDQFKEKYKARRKPWGTGQAILVCKEIVKEPFLIINADDYYGKEAYEKAFAYLTKVDISAPLKEIAMIGFELGNTLSEHGGVTRGVCQTDADSYLEQINETKNIEKSGRGATTVIDGEQIYFEKETPVSMNMWVVSPKFIEVLESGFQTFLEEIDEQYETTEYLLPIIVGEKLKREELAVKVLKSNDKWFGVTYQEDKEIVVNTIKRLLEKGVYPKNLNK